MKDSAEIPATHRKWGFRYVSQDPSCCQSQVWMTSFLYESVIPLGSLVRAASVYAFVTAHDLSTLGQLLPSPVAQDPWYTYHKLIFSVHLRSQMGCLLG